MENSLLTRTGTTTDTTRVRLRVASPLHTHVLYLRVRAQHHDKLPSNTRTTLAFAWKTAGSCSFQQYLDTDRFRLSDCLSCVRSLRRYRGYPFLPLYDVY